MNFLGIPFSIGHKDFYPNGGRSQSGCFFSRCSHLRSVDYFAESIGSDCKFLSVPCKDYSKILNNLFKIFTYICLFIIFCFCFADEFKNGKCNCNQDKPCARMGYFTKPEESGDYFLGTNNKPPFCRS